MTNPFKPHALNLFADRESVDKAMEYAHALLQTLDGPAATAATTALMVVVNTAAKLWPEAPAQSDDFTMLGGLRSRIAAIEERLGGADFFLTEEALDQRIETRIQAWAEENLSGGLENQIEEWIDDNIDDKIENWVENNLDIEDAVSDALRDKVYDTVRRVIRDEVSISLSL